jgi:hypothetical protein
MARQRGFSSETNLSARSPGQCCGREPWSVTRPVWPLADSPVGPAGAWRGNSVSKLITYPCVFPWPVLRADNPGPSAGTERNALGRLRGLVRGPETRTEKMFKTSDGNVRSLLRPVLRAESIGPQIARCRRSHTRSSNRPVHGATEGNALGLLCSRVRGPETRTLRRFNTSDGNVRPYTWPVLRADNTCQKSKVSCTCISEPASDASIIRFNR